MPRISGVTGDLVAVRAALECATASLVRIEFTERITRLRMEQARARTGLGELLDPALDELGEMASAAQSAKAEIAAVLAGMVGG